MKAAEIRRPFATHYFHSANDRAPAHCSRGAASTEEGAIRATIVRVFLGQYGKAIIYDRRTGVALYNVRPGPSGLQVRYGSGIEFKTWEAEQAVKRSTKR